MSLLFTVENKKVIPHAGTLLIQPFKKIWGRERNKEKVLEEFAYIEFMSSMLKDNPYRNYPEKIKHGVIVAGVMKDPEWKPDKLIEEAIDVFKEFQMKGSVNYSYYVAAKVAIEKTQKFFKEFSFSETDAKTGKPLYKPKEITSCLIDTEKVLANFESLKKKVEEELYEESRTKSNKPISYFADPKSLEKRKK